MLFCDASVQTQFQAHAMAATRSSGSEPDSKPPMLGR
jgi:hypothetical protein